MEKSASMKIMLLRSIHEFWRNAAMMPVGRPISRLTVSATTPNEIDTQMPLARIWLTLRPCSR